MRRQKILVHRLFFLECLTISATCLTVAVVISGAVSAKGCIRDETECFQRYAYRKEGTLGGALRHVTPENELQSASFCLLAFLYKRVKW